LRPLYNVKSIFLVGLLYLITNEATEIQETDVEEALKALQNRKAPRKDGLAYELLKCGGQAVTKQPTIFIKKILKQFKIPEERRTSIGVIIVLFKKGPGNYRGIIVLNTTLNLTTKVITNKINTIITIADGVEDLTQMAYLS
jgi:hypothetical protein